jgi:hypothetical protein
MLSRHLNRLFPELVSQLGKDLTAYLVVKTNAALNLQTQLREAGSPPEAARETALAELLPVPEDEREQPEEYEMADAAASQEAVATQALMTSLSSPQRPPRTLPI